MSDPTVPFTPGDVPLQSFTLLSSARSGMAAAVTGLTDWDHYHAGVDVTVPVLGDGRPRGNAVARLAVRGPGDVRALDTAQVIRCFPPPDTVGAEPNLLAHVEFDRPDLPWLFTPYPSSPRLAPWLALVVLRDSRWVPVDARSGLAPVVSTFHSELQPLDDSWAWAHVQLLGATSDSSTIRDGLSDDHGLANLSRLLCPRHLQPRTAYRAAVVPAYEIGRLAALGEPVPDPPVGAVVAPLAPSWQRAPGDDDVVITLPLLSSWHFTTGDRGDFQELAERLQPQTAPWYVGRRSIDTGPAFGDGGPARPDVVTGPLVSPVRPNVASADPLEARVATALAGSWTPPLVERLRGLLNRPADDADVAPATGAPSAVPRIGPPIYADRHLQRRRVTEPVGTWFGSVNLEARHRVVAGLGGRVVQHDQDLLMQAAWAQLDGLREANMRIAQGQLAQAVGTSLYERHVEVLAYGDLLQVSRPAHTELRDGAGATVHDALAASSTADTASTAAFRRLNRRAEPGVLLAQGDEVRDFQRAYDDRWVAGGAAQPPEVLAAPVPSITDFVESITQRNLDTVRNALPIDIDAEPARAAALTRQLAAIAIAPGRQGEAARDAVLTVVDPPDASFRDVVKEKSSPDDLRTAIAGGVDPGTGDLAGAQRTLAEAVRTFVEPAHVASLLDTVDPSVVAHAVEAEPGVLEQFTAAAGTILGELAGPGQVVVVTKNGAGADGGVDVTVVDAGAVDVATLEPGSVVLPGVDLAAEVTVAPDVALEADEATSDLAFEDDEVAPDVAFEDDEVAIDLGVVDQLEQIELPEGLDRREWLGQLTLPDPTDAAVALLGTTVLDTDARGSLVIDNSPDDALATWLTDVGVRDDDIIEPLVVACFEDHPPDEDQRVIDAILAWLGRRVLDPDDINGICGVEMWEFLQNALWVHQSLAPIQVSDAFRARVKALYDALVALTWPTTPVREPFAVTRAEVLAELAPAKTVPSVVAAQLAATTTWVSPDAFVADGLRAIRVVPTFDRPMHEALVSLDDRWLLPGLADVPTADLVTVVESNPAFVEAFLVGLNHEMSRELLWRGFPADLRGTFFHRFWSHLDELDELGSLTDGRPLGDHVAGQAADLLVLVVRGALVRRYPDLIAVAVRADGLEPADPARPGQPPRPIFAGSGSIAPVVLQRHRDPDVLIVGFELTPADVAHVAIATPETQWWFLLAEHPAAPRFGLDEDGPGSWESFSSPLGFLDGSAGPVAGFGADSADNAAILLRTPVRAAFPIHPLLQAIDDGGMP